MAFAGLSSHHRRDLSILGFDDASLLHRLPSQEEIRKSFRQLALLTHPDVPTGNSDAFIALQTAYENLTSNKHVPTAASTKRATPTSSSTNPSSKFRSQQQQVRQQQQQPSTTRRPTSAGASVRRPSTFGSSAPSPLFSRSSNSTRGGTFADSLRGSTATSASSSLSSSSGNSGMRARANSSNSPFTSGTGVCDYQSGGDQPHSSFPHDAQQQQQASLLVAPFPPKHKLIAPFAAFLSGGVLYNFEADASAFGSYSRIARHGDTVRLVVDAAAPPEQQPHGVIVGLAADNNLYWWRAKPSGGGLETEVRVLAPKISSPSSPKFVILRMQQQQTHFAASSSFPVSEPPSPVSSSSTATMYSSSHSSSSVSTTPMKQQQHQQFHPFHQSERLESIDRDTAHFSSSHSIKTMLEKTEQDEHVARSQLLALRAHWLSEAWYCCKYPQFAVADAARYSRLVR